MQIEMDMRKVNWFKEEILRQNHEKSGKIMKTSEKCAGTQITIKVSVNPRIRSGCIETKLNHANFIRGTINLFFATQ
jgi:hypothetical protein